MPTTNNQIWPNKMAIDHMIILLWWSMHNATQTMLNYHMQYDNGGGNTVVRLPCNFVTCIRKSFPSCGRSIGWRLLSFDWAAADRASASNRHHKLNATKNACHRWLAECDGWTERRAVQSRPVRTTFCRGGGSKGAEPHRASGRLRKSRMHDKWSSVHLKTQLLRARAAYMKCVRAICAAFNAEPATIVRMKKRKW